MDEKRYPIPRVELCPACDDDGLVEQADMTWRCLLCGFRQGPKEDNDVPRVRAG